MKEIFLIGRLGQNAIVQVQNGTTVVNFSVCVSEQYIDKSTGELVTKQDWFSLSYWGKDEKLAQHMTKGRRVFVRGLPAARFYTGKDGKTKAEITVNVKSLELLDLPAQNANGEPADLPNVPETNFAA